MLYACSRDFTEQNHSDGPVEYLKDRFVLHYEQVSTM